MSPKTTLLTSSPPHDFSRPHHWREQQSWHTPFLVLFFRAAQRAFSRCRGGAKKADVEGFLLFASHPAPPAPARQGCRISYSFGVCFLCHFLLGVIEIGKLNRWVEIRQLKFSRKAKEDLGGKGMWTNSSDVDGINEHGLRNSQTQEVGTQANESDFLLLSSYAVASPLYPYCSRRNQVL